MPQVQVNGIEVYYEVHGEGEPLIIIQGMSVDISAMSADSRLYEKYQVILFDNRGAGRTGKPDMPYSIDLMADDTIGLMDALNIKKAHVLGMSMGGRIAQAIAARHPERVRSLILVVTAARSPHNDPLVAFMYWMMLRQVKKPGFWEKNPLSKYPPTTASFLRQFEAQKAYDGRSRLGQIKAPTLIVNGSKDLSNPKRFTKELAQGIPGAKLVMFQGDHFSLGKHPEWLLDPAMEFLADVDAKIR